MEAMEDSNRVMFTSHRQSFHPNISKELHTNPFKTPSLITNEDQRQVSEMALIPVGPSSSKCHSCPSCSPPTSQSSHVCISPKKDFNCSLHFSFNIFSILSQDSSILLKFLPVPPKDNLFCSLFASISFLFKIIIHTLLSVNDVFLSRSTSSSSSHSPTNVSRKKEAQNINFLSKAHIQLTLTCMYPCHLMQCQEPHDTPNQNSLASCLVSSKINNPLLPLVPPPSVESNVMKETVNQLY